MVTVKKLAWVLSSLPQGEQCAECHNDMPQSKEKQRVDFAHNSVPFLYCFITSVQRGAPQEAARRAKY